MKASIPAKLNDSRIRKGAMASDDSYGVAGAFVIQGPCGRELAIISSGIDQQYRWEHVSVSINGRTPNWEEMCFVKHLFWDEEECVMQLHPPKSQYVNCHPDCLHLWRPIDAEIPMPDPILVGPK